MPLRLENLPSLCIKKYSVLNECTENIKNYSIYLFGWFNAVGVS